jgi:hypothetical protein
MQANFDYEPVRDAAGCQLSVTVLADRDHIRAEIREDALAAGSGCANAAASKNMRRGRSRRWAIS